ncbi:MAG: hypothetical protein ABI617_06900, partial [Sphingomicrobium sp.]
MIGLIDDRQPILVADRRIIPENEAFDCWLPGALRRAAAVAKLELAAEAAIAEQGARVIAAPGGVVSGGKLFEAKQRLPRILAAHAKGESELGDRPHLAIESHAGHRRVRLPFKPTRRDVAYAETARPSRSAIGRCVKDAQALAKLKDRRHPPWRLSRRERGIVRIGRDRIEAQAAKCDPEPVAGQIDLIELDILVREIHPDGAAQGMR